MLNSIETLPILVIPTILTSLDFSGYIGSVASILAVLYWVALTHKTVKKDHKGNALYLLLCGVRLYVDIKGIS